MLITSDVDVQKETHYIASINKRHVGRSIQPHQLEPCSQLPRILAQRSKDYLINDLLVQAGGNADAEASIVRPEDSCACLVGRTCRVWSLISF